MQTAVPLLELAELFGAATIEAGAFGGEEEPAALHVPLPDPDVGSLLGHQQPLLALAQGAAGGSARMRALMASSIRLSAASLARRWVSSAAC